MHIYSLPIHYSSGDTRFASARAGGLVADADKVVTEGLDGVGGRARLHVLGVVGDEDSLGGLHDDDTLLAL